MKRATDYVIVSGKGLTGLQKNMQEFLSRDSASAWCPIGEPFHDPSDNQGDWHQAVVGFRKDDE
jgi:hypothetical protein